MAQDWISLPGAICALSRLDGFDRGRAIELLLAMAKDMDLNTRMVLEVNRSEGPPKQNVPMLEAHWRDLEQLDSDWIDSGNAEWRDEYQWRGIQISLDDMATYFPAIERQFDENLQLVATGEEDASGDEAAVEELRDSDALLMPVPAALPEIGVVIRIEEALCQLAYGRPSFDTEVYLSSDGDVALRMPDGSTYETGKTGNEPAHLRAFREATECRSGQHGAQQLADWRSARLSAHDSYGCDSCAHRRVRCSEANRLAHLGLGYLLQGMCQPRCMPVFRRFLSVTAPMNLHRFRVSVKFQRCRHGFGRIASQPWRRTSFGHPDNSELA